jgi:hypothetical protein
VGRSFSKGAPNSRSQGSRSSLPNTRLAGVKPSGALVCHCSQQGIYIGPSSFCTWGCDGRSFQFGCRSSSPSSRRGPMSWSFSYPVLGAAAATAAIARTCLTSARYSTLCSEYTLLGMVVGKGYQHYCVFGLHGARKSNCTLVRAESSGGLSLQVLKIHEPG